MSRYAVSVSYGFIQEKTRWGCGPIFLACWALQMEKIESDMGHRQFRRLFRQWYSCVQIGFHELTCCETPQAASTELDEVSLWKAKSKKLGNRQNNWRGRIVYRTFKYSSTQTLHAQVDKRKDIAGFYNAQNGRILQKCCHIAKCGFIVCSLIKPYAVGIFAINA